MSRLFSTRIELLKPDHGTQVIDQQAYQKSNIDNLHKGYNLGTEFSKVAIWRYTP